MRLGRGVNLFVVALLLLFVAATPVLADDANNLLGGGILAIVCLVVLGLVSLGCAIYALYFLYTDAEARSGNGILWLILGFINWPIAVIVWLIIRPEKKAP